MEAKLGYMINIKLNNTYNTFYFQFFAFLYLITIYNYNKSYDS